MQPLVPTLIVVNFNDIRVQPLVPMVELIKLETLSGVPIFNRNRTINGYNDTN